MKKNLNWLVLYGACSSLALLATLPALGQVSPWYFKADLGGNVTPDTELKEFFGPVAPGSKVEFDPGIRFGFAAGYHFTDWFAVEGEVGTFWNRIHSITDATSVDAAYGNVPLLVNVRLEWPKADRLRPYIGGGLGGSGAILDVDHITLNNVHLSGTESAAVFAYQAFGGLRFKINDRMGLNVEYRYFATTDPEWETDVTFGTLTDDLRMGGTRTHAVSLSFDWSF